MRLSKDLFSLSLVIASVSACSAGHSEDLTATSNALTGAAKSIVGFEDASAWFVTSGVGALSLSSDRVQGEWALSVSGVNQNNVEISSALTAAPSAVDSTIVLHIKPPQGHAQQPWKGQVTVFVDSASRNLSARWVGAAGLEGLVEDKFSAIALDMPASIRSALAAGTVNDVKYTIKLNVPLTGPYLLDALELEPIRPKAYVGGKDVALVWDVAATPLADNYEVLRDGVVLTPGASAPNSGIPNTFIDGNVVEGRTYAYQVRAVYGQKKPYKRATFGNPLEPRSSRSDDHGQFRGNLQPRLGSAENHPAKGRDRRWFSQGQEVLGDLVSQDRKHHRLSGPPAPFGHHHQRRERASSVRYQLRMSARSAEHLFGRRGLGSRRHDAEHLRKLRV